MIYPGSRYQNSVIGIFKWSDESRRIIPYSPKNLSMNDLGQNFFVYETKHGDEVDELAQRFGDNFEDYWKICDINGIRFPLEPIPSGTSMIIPSKMFFNNSDSGGLIIQE